MGFEPTTTCLGSKDSTTELRPPLANEQSNPTPEPLLSQGNRRAPLHLVFGHRKFTATDAHMERLSDRQSHTRVHIH